MDYVVGSVAALISGNVTPNRPKLIRRALTPTKHQPSPNVTPKSEFVEDRSIFLSPTLQKKKAIIKKSPKRIFENPDLDVTSENEGNATLSSPKADKVKKHLKDELEADSSKMSPKSPKSKKNKSLDMSGDNSEVSQNDEKKKNKFSVDNMEVIQNDETPKKKKSKSDNDVEAAESISESNEDANVEKSPKKSKKRLSIINQNTEEIETTESPKKIKKRKHSKSNEAENSENTVKNSDVTEIKNLKKKNKKLKKKQKKINKEVTQENQEEKTKTNKSKPIINPNAITDKDTDSEHESDDEIESENEEANKEMLDTGPAENSSDEEEEEATPKKKVEKEEKALVSEDEVKRTLFVGNVPFTKKCKKEVKKIFSKYGTIETVRIRTVPIKDPRFTPKLAVIKNELHPERSTVNVYVKFKSEVSVAEALAENNTVLNDHHLRVTRSESTGAAHDPKCSVFVGNLPFGLEDEAFRAKFESCGEIESVRIIRDKKTNAGKGFGYINFASKDGVELALNLTEEDLTIKNRILRVKRCMQTRPGAHPVPGGGPRGGQQGNKGFVRRNDTQGGMRQGGKFQGKFQSNFRGNKGDQGNFRGNKGDQGNFRGNKGDQGNFRGNKGDQGNFRGNKGDQGNFRGNKGDQGTFRGNKEEGAYRRILNKRKGPDGGEGPPDKKGKFLSQPQKEKKARKEFVGMTAEKKKKHTFNKGQKKKKILSEILANK